jgi:hypothetical protein
MFPKDTPEDLGPFFYRPDPRGDIWCAAKPVRLVRRGPREFYLVGRRPDGEEVEARLMPGAFR